MRCWSKLKHAHGFMEILLHCINNFIILNAYFGYDAFNNEFVFRTTRRGIEILKTMQQKRTLSERKRIRIL